MSKWRKIWVVEYMSDEGWFIYNPYPTLKDAQIGKRMAEWEKALTHEFRITKYLPVERSTPCRVGPKASRP